MKTNIKQGRKAISRAGFAAGEAIFAVVVLGIIAFLVASYYGTFSGKKSSLTASIGDFVSSDLDDVVKTIVADLGQVQANSKTGEDGSRWGICFVNKKSGRDSYEVVSNVSTTGACERGRDAQVQATIEIPGDIVLTDPSETFSRSVVFERVTGALVSSEEIAITLASDSASRTITITPSGIIASGRGGFSSPTPPPPSDDSTTSVSTNTRVNVRTNVSVRTSVVGQPNAPRSLASAYGTDQIALAWVAPAPGGGAVISEYRIYRSTSSGVRGEVVGTVNHPTTVFVDRNVAKGVTYYYRVSSKNSASFESTMSNETSVMIPANQASTTSSSVPSAPLNLTASAGGSQINLFWQQPSSNGSTVIEYRVYRSLSSGGFQNFVGTSTSTSFTDLSASSGIAYYYKVDARNSAGFGPQSNEASATIYYQQAGSSVTAPSNLTAIPGSSQILLNWQASSANGVSITYRIYRSLSSGGSGQILLGTSTAPTYTDNAVSSGVTYYYQVDAQTSTAVSGRSNEVSAATNSQGSGNSNIAPNAPQNLSASASNGQVSLSWQVPVSNGANIAYYRITRSLSSGGSAAATFTVNATNYPDTGLTNGTTYYYKVEAVNGAGVAGPQSNEASATPNSSSNGGSGGGNTALPGAPQGLTANPGDGRVTLSWQAPAGGSVNDYVIYRSGTPNANSGIIATQSGTTYTDYWLSNGTTYYYSVAARNGAGTGPKSAEVSAVPRSNQTSGGGTGGGSTGGSGSQAAAPSAPQNLRLPNGTSENGRVTLQWDAPSSTGGDTIIEYKIMRSDVSNGTITAVYLVSGTTFTYTDTAVTNGRAYYYKVAARNNWQVGSNSNQISATPSAPQVYAPGAPNLYNVNSSGGVVYLNWSAPSDGGDPIVEYKVMRMNSSGTITAVYLVSGSTLNYSDNQVTVGTTYSYKVSARNGYHVGPSSNEFSIKAQ